MTERAPSAGDSADVLTDDEVGRRVVFGGAQRVLGFIAANLLTVGAALLLLRYLGVADFGRYGTVLALLGVVQGISDAGLTATGSRELALARTPAERRDILAHVLGLRIVLTGAGVGVAIGFAAAAGYDDEMIAGTALGGFGVFLTSIQSAMLLPLAVEMRNAAIALNDIFRQGVLLATFVVLVLAEATVAWFLAAQIAVGVAALAVAPFLLSRHGLVAPQWTIERLRALAAIALPVAAATVLGVLYLRVLVVEMSLLSDSEEEIGYFVTSTRVLEVVGGLPMLVISVVLPVVTVAAREDHERLVYITARTTEVMALGGILVAIVVWALADPIIAILAGAEYEPAVAALQIQCFAAITIFLAAAWQPTLFGMGRVRSLVVAVTTGLLTLIVSGLVLIPAHEATGAATAAVIGEVAMATSLLVSLRSAGPGPWVRPAALARIALAGALAIAAGVLLPVPDVLTAVIAAGVFCTVVWALRAVPGEITAAARAAVERVRPH